MKTPWIARWPVFLCASVLLLFGAAAFEFLTSDSTLPADARLLVSLIFGGRLLLIALAAGFAVWLVKRVLKIKTDAAEARESVVWFACVLGTVVLAARVFN